MQLLHHVLSFFTWPMVPLSLLHLCYVRGRFARIGKPMAHDSVASLLLLRVEEGAGLVQVLIEVVGHALALPKVLALDYPLRHYFLTNLA